MLGMVLSVCRSMSLGMSSVLSVDKYNLKATKSVGV